MVGNIVIDETAGACAASAFNHVITVDLEVYERAVTLQGAGGELYLQQSQAVVRPWALTGQGSKPSFGTGNPAIDMGNVRNFTSRSGSYAFSGTG